MKTLPARILAYFLFFLCFIFEANAQEQWVELQKRQSIVAEEVRPLKARAIPLKPAKTVIQPWHESAAILIKFAEGSKVRRRRGDIVSFGGADLAGLEQVLKRYGVRSSELTRHIDLPEADLDQLKHKGQSHSGRELADLNNYFRLSVPDSVDAGLLCDELNALPIVELAAPMPKPGSPTADLDPPTDDYSGLQGYRAALGISDHQGVIGIDGSGMAFVDIEFGWYLNHEDLDLPPETVIDGGTSTGTYRDHGTAILGVIVGGDNGYGITGLAASATPYVASSSVTQGIALSTLHLSPGDAVVVPQAYWVCDDLGIGPWEFYQDVFDVIETATANGIIVVEAAANDGFSLDDPKCISLFDPNYRDSGAIMVGGATKSGIPISNYGSRVNVHGWALGVTTTGFGDLNPENTDPLQRYTRTFNGTSSASAMVTGAILAIQGARKALGLNPLEPLQMRQLLINTGTPQTGEHHIGPLPNVADALGLGDPYDDFVDARNITDSLPALKIGSNFNATKEAGEPSHAGDVGGASVWWSWSPENDGIVTINTFGSSFNTLLAAYTGASVNALTLVAQNDDTDDDSGNLQSEIVFNASADETYYIAVDGFNGLEGEIRLNLLFDTDGDGIYDQLDNCISIANPGQEPSAINPDCGEVCETSGCGGPKCVNH